MSPTEILCKGLAGWRWSVPLSLEKSLQVEGQECLRVLRHFQRILSRALWNRVRMTHPKMPGGGPKDGRMCGSVWMEKQCRKRKKNQDYGKFQYQEHARRSLVKPPAQSNIRRCDNMVRGSLKPSLEKPRDADNIVSLGSLLPSGLSPQGKMLPFLSSVNFLASGEAHCFSSYDHALLCRTWLHLLNMQAGGLLQRSAMGSHLGTFPLKSHLHTIQIHSMSAPYAGCGSLLLALPQAPLLIASLTLYCFSSKNQSLQW